MTNRQQRPIQPGTGDISACRDCSNRDLCKRHGQEQINCAKEHESFAEIKKALTDAMR